MYTSSFQSSITVVRLGTHGSTLPSIMKIVAAIRAGQCHRSSKDGLSSGACPAGYVLHQSHGGVWDSKHQLFLSAQ